MLILTRKKGEVIFIGEDIRIMLVGIQGGQAKIGVACPAHLAVMRGELGPRTRKAKWPNLSPDEITFLLYRRDCLREWWLMDNVKECRREVEDLVEIIDQLKNLSLEEMLEAYSHFYKKEATP